MYRETEHTLYKFMYPSHGIHCVILQNVAVLARHDVIITDEAVGEGRTSRYFSFLRKEAWEFLAFNYIYVPFAYLSHNGLSSSALYQP